MKLGRMAAAALALSVGFGSFAEAGNGSNYIAMLNGLDYFFGTGPYTGAAGLRGTWRCFPSENLHSPTRVVDVNNPSVGTYAAKVCAIHQVVTASPGYFVNWPTIALSSSPGTCHATGSGGLNFGIGSAGPGVGFFLAGPLDGGGPGAVTAWVIAGAGFTNPTSAPNFVLESVLNLVGAFNPLGGGTISAVPIPDGHSMTLFHGEANNQTGAGSRMYYTGSLDERNICSGYSFLLSSNASGLVGIGFNQAWEWATGVGTLDATMTNIVAVGASGGGPSGLNAHSSSTAFAQPFDQGTGATTVSLTATTPFAFTSAAAPEILGYASYDESNQFGGSNRLVAMNLAGLTVDGSTSCLNGTNPAFLPLATGGAGGPALSGAGNQPRFVAKLDTVALTLLSNPIWIATTIHGTTPGGSNRPWVPGAAGISGSTGNTGGAAIPIPPLPILVGLRMYQSSVGLNAAGTAIAPLANSGHSHSNGTAFNFFP